MTATNDTPKSFPTYEETVMYGYALARAEKMSAKDVFYRLGITEFLADLRETYGEKTPNENDCQEAKQKMLEFIREHNGARDTFFERPIGAETYQEMVYRLMLEQMARELDKLAGYQVSKDALAFAKEMAEAEIENNCK